MLRTRAPSESRAHPALGSPPRRAAGGWPLRRGTAKGCPKRGTLALGLALLPGALGAQERGSAGRGPITGTVSDPGGRPLAGVFVSEAGSNWGVLTGADGRFVLPDLVPGTVSLAAELIGYETLSWTGHPQPGEAITLVLVPKPVLLQGLTVVTDRFASRRKAVAVAVRAFDRTTLSTSPHATLLDFLRTRGGTALMSCQGTWSSFCVWSRGRMVEPSVWIDESPVLGGLDYLQMFQPHELYMVEVYGGGRHIRVYTNHYMERAANQRLFPLPFIYY